MIVVHIQSAKHIHEAKQVMCFSQRRQSAIKLRSITRFIRNVYEEAKSMCVVQQRAQEAELEELHELSQEQRLVIYI